MYFNQKPDQHAWLLVITSAIRAAFGLVWAIDAYLTWRPSFPTHFLGYLQNAMNGQPDWLKPWFQAWISITTPDAGIFIWLVRIIETLIAISLLFGLARKWGYIAGSLFSLILWATVDGFGGPYTAGVANLGPALIYLMVFIGLAALNRALGRTPYSLDYYIEQRYPAWTRIAEMAPVGAMIEPTPRLSWPMQSAAILSLAVAAVFFFATMQSSMNVAAATPENAAAAVSPLSLAAGLPSTGAVARDATLPPLLSQGNEVNIDIRATDQTVAIANGVTYQAWTFNDTVPGPTFHVRQGQKVNVTFTNNGSMDHSIDFHAAEIAPDQAYHSVKQGESIKFSFSPNTPGVFVYHCGTPPVLMHMANGMYGAIVVDPAKPLPPADVSYVIVQGEWYTSQAKGNLMAGNYAKMQAGTPDEVVFNGVANQYKDHPLPAKAGQLIRIYFVDAGPNLSSAFHVIGGMFQAVYPDGNPDHAQNGVSTYEVAPGQGVIFDITIPAPGKYPFVDHSMKDMNIGAVGVLNVTP